MTRKKKTEPIPIATVETEPPKTPDAAGARSWIWILPAVKIPVLQHAWRNAPEPSARMTACGAFPTEGGIYPPSPMIPKCPECIRATERWIQEQAGAGHVDA